MQKALPHALFFPASREARATGEGEDCRLDIPCTLPVRYLAKFPATVKGQLDQLRSHIVPTIPGHHALKIVDPVAVDEAEAELREEPLEFHPDHLRYVDLELDVVRLPDGASRLEDIGVLVEKLASGLLPPALGEEAIRAAIRLLQGPSAAALHSVP